MWNTALAPASIIINNGTVFSSFCFFSVSFMLPFISKVFQDQLFFLASGVLVKKGH